jgi:hypothetical protein
MPKKKKKNSHKKAGEYQTKERQQKEIQDHPDAYPATTRLAPLFFRTTLGYNTSAESPTW